jgi:pyruvate dehydrogenase E1 component alpha subunit
MKSLKQYDKEFLEKLLGEMLLIRRFEEKAAQMYGLRKIGGFCHLYNGQEAVAIGSIAAVDLSQDYVLTAYRDHGHALACGMDPKSVMAELYGKVTGCSRGKGGSMHMFDAGKHMLGGNGIVAAQIPVATGVAFASRYREDGGITLCYFGDGAIHQGSFHESLNLAKIWDLPVIYICENNQFGMGTNVRRVSAVEDFAVMGASYGINGETVDGMDVIAVYESIKKASEEIKKSAVPYLLDVKTYRYKGHSMSDPAKYRTREELDSYKKQDPIELLRVRMEEEKLITEKRYKEMDSEIRKRIDEAVDFAEKSEEPPFESIYEDIYL